jgi:hypothetical protein
MESAITVKGQAPIPKAIREHLRLKNTAIRMHEELHFAETPCSGFARHYQVKAPGAGGDPRDDRGCC